MSLSVRWPYAPWFGAIDQRSDRKQPRHAFDSPANIFAVYLLPDSRRSLFRWYETAQWCTQNAVIASSKQGAEVITVKVSLGLAVVTLPKKEVLFFFKNAVWCGVQSRHFFFL